MPSCLSADTSSTSANPAFADTSATKGSSRSRGRARSILFTSRITGRPAASSRSRARSSSGVNRSASITKTLTSESASEASAVRFMQRFMARLWLSCSPGRSTNTICNPGRVSTPCMRLRVVCGLGLTIDSFLPSSALSSVDFPTFGRPTRAAKPQRLLPSSPPIGFCSLLMAPSRRRARRAAVAPPPVPHAGGSSPRPASSS